MRYRRLSASLAFDVRDIVGWLPDEGHVRCYARRCDAQVTAPIGDVDSARYADPVDDWLPWTSRRERGGPGNTCGKIPGGLTGDRDDVIDAGIDLLGLLGAGGDVIDTGMVIFGGHDGSEGGWRQAQTGAGWTRLIG